MGSEPLSHLEHEAREQGAMLAGRTDPGWERAAAAADLLARADVDYLVLAARGSSDNAARYAQYLLGVDARIPVALAAPWLYSGAAPPVLRRGAVVAISQSGRSPDINEVVATARDQGRPTVVLTNDPTSPLAAQADVVVPLLAGVERSVAATKTYLASLHAVAQIATCLRPELDPDRAQWFERLPAIVSGVVDEQLGMRSRFDPLAEARLVTVVGRGLQFSTAHETSLKIRELSGIPAEAFSEPDLMHGPIAALSSAGAVWLISGTGREQPGADFFAAPARGTGVCVAVSDREDVLAGADIGIRIRAGLPEWLAPIVSVIPGQVAALRLGELLGVELDQPHGLRKVTLTR